MRSEGAGRGGNAEPRSLRHVPAPLRRSGEMTEQELVINPREAGFYRLDLAQLFGNANPVILEIGSGKGRFLIGTAMERPDRNFIGIEKSLHYHRVVRDRVVKRGIQNVRL